jgi:uncharacterized protein (TIGR01777 family)
MNILIAGASGFIGTNLVHHLSQNHNITVIGRNFNKLQQLFGEDISKLTFEHLANFDAINYDLIINLSGSNIGAKRWNQSIKQELIESRTSTNHKLVEWLLNQKATPRFFCANAIGIYGAQEISNNTFDESTSRPSTPNDFLQKICFAWEKSLQKAIDASIPVTTMRFGVVLKKGCGMLQKLELPFRLGLGSILGNGNQTLSWIHYQDLLNAIDFLIANPNITGAVNITSPIPVAQKEFALSLAKSLERKLFFRTPAWFIKLLFGEMGEYLLLKGQKVLPKRLTEMGFKFLYPNIEMALSAEYTTKK